MKIQNKKETEKNNYKSAPGEVMIGLAKILFGLLIFAGLMSYFLLGGEIGIAVLVGCCLEGLMVYAILYGIGNIVKNTSETKDEIKEVNEKLDKLTQK